MGEAQMGADGDSPMVPLPHFGGAAGAHFLGQSHIVMFCHCVTLQSRLSLVTCVGFLSHVFDKFCTCCLRPIHRSRPNRPCRNYENGWLVVVRLLESFKTTRNAPNRPISTTPEITVKLATLVITMVTFQCRKKRWLFPRHQRMILLH